jgi:integrase
MTTQRLPRGIRKRPRKVHPETPWEGRYQKDGKRISVYARTMTECEKKLAEAKRRAGTGLQPTDQRLTVAKYLDGWLGERRGLREVTVARYRSLLEGHVIPVVGSRKLAELQPADVRLMLAKMEAKGLGPTTRSHARGALRAALNDALRDGLVERNAASLVRIPAPRTRKLRALSDDEMRGILDAVRGDRLGPLFLFIAATGCRLGEALGLRWRDVHEERDEVEFAQTLARLGGRDVWSRPKTDTSERVFPITAGVRAALDAQRELQESGGTGAPPQFLPDGGTAHGPLVFTALDGGPLSGTFVTHRLGDLLEAAELPKLRTHDLRHLFVSSLFAKGVPLEVIGSLIGHKSPAVTRAVYLHLRTDQKAAAAGKLDDLFAETAS